MRRDSLRERGRDISRLARSRARRVGFDKLIYPEFYSSGACLLSYRALMPDCAFRFSCIERGQDAASFPLPSSGIHENLSRLRCWVFTSVSVQVKLHITLYLLLLQNRISVYLTYF